MTLTAKQLQIATGSNAENAERFLPHLISSMNRFQISDKTEIAAMLATFGHETQGLTKLLEDLYYRDPARLARIFLRAFDTNGDREISAKEIEDAKPYTKNPTLLAKKLYNNYQGRGLIQLTWEGNYREIGAMVNRPYVDQPDLLLAPPDAALSAVAFWVRSGAGKVAADPKKVRVIINGKAALGLAEYTELFNGAVKALG